MCSVIAHTHTHTQTVFDYLTLGRDLFLTLRGVEIFPVNVKELLKNPIKEV